MARPAVGPAPNRNRPAAQPLGRRHALTLEVTTEGAEAPTELRIFKAGANDTTKGVFNFTAQSAELVMRAAADWGNDLSFDYEHAALQPVDNGPVPAAGWFRLELRDTPDGPELWAVDIRWTDRARQMIEAREIRYISPAFTTSADGEITSLVNVALTNLPATKRLEPLIAASVQALSSLSVEQIIDQARSQLTPEHPHLADAWAVEVYLDRLIFMIEDGRTYHQVPISIDGDSVSLAGEPIEVKREWVPLEREPERSNEMKLNSTTLIALGLAAAQAASATDDEIQAAIERGAEQLQALRSLVPEGAEVVGTVTAWRDAAQRVEALTARVAELEDAAAQRELAEVLDAAIAEGKVTPAQREKLVELFTTERGVNLEGLKAYVAASPRVVALTRPGLKEPIVTTSATGGKPAVDVTGKSWADLSNVERHNLRVTDPETFQRLLDEHRAARAN